MPTFDTGNEEVAYEDGYNAGVKDGRYDALEDIKIAPPQDFSDPDAVRIITNRAYLRHLNYAKLAGADDERHAIADWLAAQGFAATADMIRKWEHAK